MYWLVMGFGRVDHAVSHFLFMIYFGVLQGCPLSADFFVLAIDPFLQAFELSVVQAGKGVIGACADDIGASLASIVHLVDMFKIFDVARLVAGLSLKAKKCVIIPVSSIFSNELHDAIRTWLASNLPRWADFTVSAAGKYLGAYLGPAASQKLWTNAANKWASRAHTIGSAALPLQLSVMLYNTRAITTIGYIAQLALLPDKLLRQEGFILAKILHPPNFFKGSDYFNLVHWGFCHIRSLLALAASSMIRAALETITVWQECLPWLASSASDLLPATRWNKGEWWPSFWDSPVIATQLADASRGLPSYAKLKGAGVKAILELSRARSISSAADKPIKTQKFLYDYIVAELYPDSLADTFTRRLAVMAPRETGPVHFIAFGNVQRFLSQRPPAEAISVLKSWAHAWTTSSRMHEAVVLPCVLGCRDALDTQEHYLACERFWRLVYSSRSSSSRYRPRSVLGRLGLLPLSFDALQDLVVASRFYHYIKFSGSWHHLHSLAQAGDLQALALACKRAVQAARYSA